MGIPARQDRADRLLPDREEPRVRIAARAEVRGEAGAGRGEREPVAPGPAEGPLGRVLEPAQAAPASLVRRERVEARLDPVAVPAHGTAAEPEERPVCREPMRVAM